MIPAPPPKISVVIPIYGNVGDLDNLLTALRNQTLKPYEIIIVDSSPKPLANPPQGPEVKYVKNPKDIALSWDYNLGLKENSGDYQLDMQQDCLPEDPTALERLYLYLVEPGKNRVAALAQVTLPRRVFDGYNFWGKVLMARWIGRVQQGISGKFDLVRKDVFLKINGYNTESFSFAGEDMDLFMRLSQHGEVFVAPDVEIIHYHHQSLKGGWIDLFKKHYQLAESFGALVRHWGLQIRKIPYTGHWTHHLAKYLYPLVLLIPLAPVKMSVAIFFLSQFTNMESWRVLDIRTPLLLVVNPMLFLVRFWGSVVGFVTGKQRYSVNK